MRRFVIIIFAICVCSCTIKQDRTVCPSYLDLTVLKQSSGICPDGKLLCSVWNIDGARVADDPLTGMTGRDTTLQYGIYPRQNVLACVSNNTDPAKCVAPTGEQFQPLYCVTEEIRCIDEVDSYTISKLHKNHIKMKVVLSDRLREQNKRGTIRVSAPVNGVSFPSLSLRTGLFNCTVPITDSISVVIPRQREEGLVITYSGEEEGYVFSTDLSEFLKEKKYDMSAVDLSDFRIVLDVSDLDFRLIIVDWKDYLIGDYIF